MPAYIFPSHYQKALELIKATMNDETTHAFGGIAGNGVCMRRRQMKVVFRERRVTSICPRDVPDLITSGEAP